MKEFCEKLSLLLKKVFGYGIMICLFAGGLTFFGYVVALIVGGNIAAEICSVIYNNIIPVIIEISVSLVLLGLVSMYLNGEIALTPGVKQTRNKKEEK